MLSQHAQETCTVNPPTGVLPLHINLLLLASIGLFSVKVSKVSLHRKDVLHMLAQLLLEPQLILKKVKLNIG